MREASSDNVFKVPFDSLMQGSYNRYYIWQMSTDFVSISVLTVYKSFFSDQIFAAVWTKSPKDLSRHGNFSHQIFKKHNSNQLTVKTETKP